MNIVGWIILYLAVAASVLAVEKVSNSTMMVDHTNDTPNSRSVLMEGQHIHVFNHTIPSFLENLYDGVSEEVMKGAFTFDEDGNPMIYVNKSQILLLEALLMEHDERYHEDWPGHALIIPEENLKEDENINEGYSEESIDENLLEDGHILASSIDNALTGHVNPKDEADLQKMMDRPPRRVRVRRAFFNKGSGRTWPEGIIPYVFDRNINYAAKDAALQSMKHVMSKIPCVKFKPASRGARNYVLITSNGQSCFSQNLGFRPGQNVMNLGQGCGYTVSVHEWGHVMGAIHTQTRPDRDDYVEINWDNIQPNSKRQFYKNNWKITKDDTEYDYDSMMHYPTYGFVIDNRYTALRVKPPRRFNLPRYGHRTGLSKLDEKSFRDWYGCPVGGQKKKQPADEIDEIDEIDKMKFKLEVDGGEDCLVSPWSGWTKCVKGRRERYRKITQDAKQDGTCPQLGKLKFTTQCKTRTVRDIKTLGAEVSNDVETNDGDVAEAHMTKIVSVTAGQPIILVVSNPNNLPVKWYHVVDGADVEIEKDDKRYHIERTRVANERLITENSGVKDDGQLFVAKIAMSHSVLSVAWSITVDSV